MILTGLFTWFCSIFNDIDPIVIPDLETILGALDMAINAMCDGVSLLGLFIGDTGLFAISIYLFFVLAVEIFYAFYQFIWFVLKKLPMLNVDQ